jgi:ribosome assembly protein YihI (activator of Der GTPase)|tara:strand:- start:305 stop:484 length:180 start_codon:yes stop_codon:yes gene_type:complete
MNHIKTELDRKMEEFNNMKQEMIDELEAKIKLNREKQRHLDNEIDRYEIALDKLKGQIH